jgi:hypothetical protein
MASFREEANVDKYTEAFNKVLGHPDELVTYARGIDYREPWEAESRLW